MIDVIAVRERIEKAHQEINRLCHAGKWRMCIPVQDDDSDRLLAASLADIPKLLDDRERLLHMLEHAWGIVANVDHGVWETNQRAEWIETARKFIDDAHAMGAYAPDRAKE